MSKLLNSKIKQLETKNSELQDIYLISTQNYSWLVILPSINSSHVLQGIGYGGYFSNYKNKMSSPQSIDIQNNRVKLNCFINVSKLIREDLLNGTVQDIINMYCSDDIASKTLIVDSLTQIFKEKYKHRYDFI